MCDVLSVLVAEFISGIMLVMDDVGMLVVDTIGVFDAGGNGTLDASDERMLDLNGTLDTTGDGTLNESDDRMSDAGDDVTLDESDDSTLEAEDEARPADEFWNGSTYQRFIHHRTRSLYPRLCSEINVSEYKRLGARTLLRTYHRYITWSSRIGHERSQTSRARSKKRYATSRGRCSRGRALNF